MFRNVIRNVIKILIFDNIIKVEWFWILDVWCGMILNKVNINVYYVLDMRRWYIYCGRLNREMDRNEFW